MWEQNTCTERWCGNETPACRPRNGHTFKGHRCCALQPRPRGRWRGRESERERERGGEQKREPGVTSEIRRRKECRERRREGVHCALPVHQRYRERGGRERAYTAPCLCTRDVSIVSSCLSIHSGSRCPLLLLLVAVAAAAVAWVRIAASVAWMSSTATLSVTTVLCAWKATAEKHNKQTNTTGCIEATRVNTWESVVQGRRVMQGKVLYKGGVLHHASAVRKGSVVPRMRVARLLGQWQCAATRSQ